MTETELQGIPLVEPTDEDLERALLQVISNG